MLDVIKHRNKTISKATVCKRGITEEISIQCAEYRVENGKGESKGVRGDDRSKKGIKVGATPLVAAIPTVRVEETRFKVRAVCWATAETRNIERSRA